MKTILVGSALVTSITMLLAGSAQAQSQPSAFRFEQVAYLTCGEVHAMVPEQRRAVAVFLAEHSARYRGVQLPDGEEGTRLGMLVRSSCTMGPEQKLFGVIDRAIQVERDKLAKR